MEYKFCPKCGKQLKERMTNGRYRHVCPLCGFIHFKNPVVGVAVILMDENKRLLLGKKKDGGWCIPCGYVEWNESVEEAAVREFKEETGLDVMLGSVFAVQSNFHNPELHTVGIWYEGIYIGGSLGVYDDLSDLKWFSLNHAPKLKFPTDQQVLKRLQARVNNEA